MPGLHGFMVLRVVHPSPRPFACGCAPFHTVQLLQPLRAAVLRLAQLICDSRAENDLLRAPLISQSDTSLQSWCSYKGTCVRTVWRGRVSGEEG